ncbi:UbiA family prenyltransferase [Paracoccus sp. (in: a-proteobacteria)]|uniref:UbiA family prenyltransferase n=1 Tax=Paracoccus sp. TaxID=267 RepID=UPI0026E05FD0|nr:UbiA family prenyltransferase [Paracoccus sp. (in: a-proteobacteria)]MDO5647463.1 UbiA family prenyltransferase [Paracoccus sp. (in: a-proteobacteria)]
MAVELLPDRDIPLIVDLDGTLCRTDTLHEGVLGLAAARPADLLRLPGWLGAGKAAFKREIADRHVLDPALLPYDDAVIAMIEQARADGRVVGLVSAADDRQVQAVAAHLGLFDLAVGTGHADAPQNLRGQAKADFLTARFGARGFDYIGDSATDLPVWAAARRGYGVRLNAATRKAADGLNLTEITTDAPGPLRALVKAARPHQWVKNLLILLPVLTAQNLSALPVALLAMLCFSLAASSVYILNDLVDLPSDRAHPRKCRRPFAAGSANAVQGLTAAAGLLGVSLLLALLLPATFLGVLLMYLVATSAYSFWLKRKMMVDIISLATLYTLRIVAGGAATGIVLSPWLLVFSMFLFFALAAIKRQAELEDLARRGGDKPAGRNMLVSDLPVLQAMSVGASQLAVLVFALYSQDKEVQTHFGRPDLLLLVCPVLFLWLGRMQLMTRRGYMTDDPIVFTFKDRASVLCALMMFGLFVLSAIGGQP